MKFFGVGWLLVAVLWTAFLAKGTGLLPALGPLLGVRDGLWNHRNVVLSDGRIEGLREPVTVTFDASGVPHFFAHNEPDLYLAQGYVMASQRLFQMDVSTRITAGRLSEWFGERTRKVDEFFVRFGMRESARRSLATFNADPQTMAQMNSFTAGVNAYIRSLNQLPPEYRILGVKPEPWDNMRIIHMAKELTFGLAGRSYDHYLSRIQQQLGTERVLDLFPEFSLLDDIVYPNKGKRRRRESGDDATFVTALREVPFFPLPAAGNGSNNWAVSAKKSATGHSLMANDTHLDNMLPNVWYEVQLAVPAFNVYGVSLTAVPGIINGLNSKVSWGPTNGTTDVLDFYEIEFESENSNRYKSDGEWVEPEVQNEQIEVRGSKGEKVSVLWTRYGVVLHREGRTGLAAVWRGHETQLEMKALHELYASENLDQCLAAFNVWSAPVQNFICADTNDVAIEPVGFLPRRKVGEGRFIMKGGAPDVPMQLPISENERPRLVRPRAGYVLSANQRQTGPEYPYYLGWDFEDPFRGALIRRRLLEKEKLTPDDMMRIQNDRYDMLAEIALPILLRHVEHKTLSPEQEQVLKELREWRYEDVGRARAPAVFAAWFNQLRFELFADDYKVQSSNFFPKDSRILALLQRVTLNPNDSDSYWVDNRATPEKETIETVVRRAFLSAWETLSKDQGSDPALWNFKKWIRTGIRHVARLPGFGVDLLEMDGGRESIRGNKGIHGAVYKFVVAHDPVWPKAWIQVPGGNEGDPFNRDYERFVTDWAEGKMRPVEFYRDEVEARQAAVRTLVLSP